MAKMDFTKLMSAIDATSTAKKSYNDDSHEYWTCATDKVGNGSAIIRFLPNKNIDDFPFVRIFSHGFKNEANGRWYIENSLSTLGQADPVGEMNSAQWARGTDEDREEVRKRKRRLSYISNIIVLKDPANPENEGKVFKFKYGKKIFDKIVSLARPEFDSDEPINVFDPIEGANFKLRIKQVSGYKNYDDSSFEVVKPLLGGDSAKIDMVLAQCYDLNELLDPKNFKSYEELERKLKWVLGTDRQESAPSLTARTTEQALQNVQSDVGLDDNPFETASTTTPTEARRSPPVAFSTTDDDDDDDAFFKSLSKSID